MPRIDSLRMLLIEQLKDIYDAENRLTKAIPKLIKKSTHDELIDALETHLGETEEHVSRIRAGVQRARSAGQGQNLRGDEGADFRERRTRERRLRP